MRSWFGRGQNLANFVPSTKLRNSARFKEMKKKESATTTTPKVETDLNWKCLELALESIRRERNSNEFQITLLDTTQFGVYSSLNRKKD